jgi:ubiquinone/menaquinone biosynthesis C-methylase UbiE
MSEKMPMGDRQPHLEKPRRGTVGSRLMRFVSEGPVEKWLEKRGEWMIQASGIQKHLAPKVEWRDPKKKILGAKKGVDVLSIGGGKGHEADEIDAVLPGSTIRIIDPHDFYTRPVKKRFEKLTHDTKYLGEENAAEQLTHIPDQSQDGITLFFVLHHLRPENSDFIMAELQRVLKPDGKIFVAEDLVQDDAERQKAEQADRLLNLDPSKRPLAFRSAEEWKNFFTHHGFDMQIEKIVEEDDKDQKKKVRHGFFVLTQGS